MTQNELYVFIASAVNPLALAMGRMSTTQSPISAAKDYMEEYYA